MCTNYYALQKQLKVGIMVIALPRSEKLSNNATEMNINLQ